MAYGTKGRRALGVAALGVLLGCFESPVTPTTTGGSSGQSGGACIPGETQTCLCVGGSEGVQACNAEGTGYDDCACVGATSSDDTTGSTGESATTATSTSTTAGSADSVDSVDSGPADTGTADTGPPGDAPYGACQDDGCPEGEVCIMDPANGFVVCAALCNGPSQCPDPPVGYRGDQGPSCEDVTGTGEAVCVLPCSDNQDCLDGMVCSFELCVWV